MKYSINKLKSIKNRFDARIDAEFYLPYYAKIDKTLNKHSCKNLAELTYKITDGTHYTPQYVTKGTPFLSAINVKENFLDLDCGYQYITSSEHNVLYKRCAPRAGDILLRKVGVGPRYATVVPNDIFEFSLFVSVALLKPKDINFYYLSTFINSKYGQIQLLRFNKGISQPDLHLEDIETLRVPILDNGFQNLIENIVKISLENKKIVKELLSCSDELLLKNLNLINWRPEHKLYSIKKYSDVKNVNRFDAEYFQPKYDGIIEKIKSYSNGWDKLSNIIQAPKKGIEVGSEEYCEQGIPFVRVSNLSQHEINNNNMQYISEEYYNSIANAYQPKKGEILLSKDGTPGIAYYLSETPRKMIHSGGILRLIVNNEEYLPEYLTLVLNSIVVQMQVERVSSGALIKHWLVDEIQNTLIPKLEMNKQIEIVEQLKEATKLRKQSKQLLEIAKRGVEIAIEENEDIATKWINEQLLKLGINLN